MQPLCICCDFITPSVTPCLLISVPLLLGLEVVYIVQCNMHRFPNKHVSPLKDITNEMKFDANVLIQIVKAKTSLFNKICREIHVERHNEIKYVFLNK